MSDWNVETCNPQDVEDLAAFTGLDPAACLQRLQAYEFSEMAEAWRRANPKTPEEIRRFYETTDLYIWELTKWHQTTQYSEYLALLDTLIERYPPAQFPHVLDYGSGIGTAALHMLQAGYRVTIADVPGETLRYAQFRLRRHGHNPNAVEVTTNRPHLPKSYDILVSFDVLEHVPAPDRLVRHLVKALRNGGIAALVTSFFTNADFPHHLPENTRGLPDVWSLVLSGCGLDAVGINLYQKGGPVKTQVRHMRYWLWNSTGFYITRLPRLPR